MQVTDSNPVRVDALYARVVTSVEWGDQPASNLAFPQQSSASALLANVMTAEGHSGLLFTSVAWDDGHVEEVGYVAGGDETVLVTAGSSNVALTAPNTGSNSENFWKVHALA